MTTERPRNRDRKRNEGQNRQDDGEESLVLERVVQINRVAAVVKGGRRFSFSATVVVGDGQGNVGYGFGKAREVPAAVEKAMKAGRENMITVALKGNTIPYQTVGRYSAARVIMVPASEGTGVIAGDVVRAVVECAGIKDILTKSVGNNNKLNLLKAAINGLQGLKSKEDLEKLRGVTIETE